MSNDSNFCKHRGGCLRVAHRRGWCAMHYARVLSAGIPGPVESYYVTGTTTCQHPDGCDRPSVKWGLCNMHYLRLKRNGDLGPAHVINVWDDEWRQNEAKIPKSRVAELRALLLVKQGGVCALCQLVDPNDMWMLDHDHSCCSPKRGGHRVCANCVRLVLCNKCNTALGYFHDDPDLLRRAADYVTQFRPSEVGNQ